MHLLAKMRVCGIVDNSLIWIGDLFKRYERERERGDVGENVDTGNLKLKTENAGNSQLFSQEKLN